MKNHRTSNNMAFKFVVFFAALAYANAGLLPAAAPVAYSPASAVSHAYISQPAVAVAAPLAAAPVAVHAPAIGISQQNVLRSYGGNQAISTYSKAVDSGFSSVRKYDTRITNDALSVYAHAAPAVATYAAPAYAHAAYAAPAYSTYAHAAPAYSTYAHAAPAVASYAAAPVVAKAAVPVAYSPAVAVSHMSFSGLGVNYGW